MASLPSPSRGLIESASFKPWLYMILPGPSPIFGASVDSTAWVSLSSNGFLMTDTTLTRTFIGPNFWIVLWEWCVARGYNYIPVAFYTGPITGYFYLQLLPSSFVMSSTTYYDFNKWYTASPSGSALTLSSSSVELQLAQGISIETSNYTRMWNFGALNTSGSGYAYVASAVVSASGSLLIPASLEPEAGLSLVTDYDAAFATRFGGLDSFPRLIFQSLSAL